MMDLDFLERLIKALDQSSVDSLEIERGGTRVRLSKTPAQTAMSVPMPNQMYAPAPAALAPAPAAAPVANEVAVAAATPTSNLLDITSPMVGTFYSGPAADAPPYADVGTRVKAGDNLCIIEAMKLMNELECEVKGTIVEICVENAQPVEYGQLLFRVDPT